MRRLFLFAIPLLAALGVMASTAPSAKADWYCGPGWFLYHGRCVPYGYYYGPGISFGWGPTYHHHHHHYGGRYYHHGGHKHGHHHGHGDGKHGHGHGHGHKHAHHGGKHGHGHGHGGKKG